MKLDQTAILKRYLQFVLITSRVKMEFIIGMSELLCMGKNITLIHGFVVHWQGPGPIMHKNVKCYLLWSGALSLKDYYAVNGHFSFFPSFKGSELWA